MLEHPLLEQLAKQLTETLPKEAQLVKEELQKTFLALLTSTFAKMNLVTREEFDVQTKVLLKTRLKLESLQTEFENFMKNKDNTSP